MEWQELNIEQNTDEWYFARLGRFTASRIGDLFSEPRSKADRLANRPSKSALNYITEVVTEVIHGKPVVKSLDRVPAIAYGKKYEPEAVEWYEAYHEIETQPSGFFVGGEWLGASPDRIIPLGGVWESKCCYSKTEHTKRILLYSQAKDGKDFLYSYNKLYWFQIQFQMYATGTEWGHWVSYDPDLIENDIFAPNSMLAVPIEFDSSIDFKGKTEWAIELAKKILDDHRDYNPKILGKGSLFT